MRETFASMNAVFEEVLEGLEDWGGLKVGTVIIPEKL
jgi:hypothetical protein